MDNVYRLQGIEFEWDENKAQTNFEKHGVTFEEAAEVFFDPFYQIGNTTTNNEQRDLIIGYSLAQRLLLVVYVERGRRSRIISARPATRTERKLYEQAWSRIWNAFKTQDCRNSKPKDTDRYIRVA